MKIKLAILEKDVVYLRRILSVFGTKYADNLQLYSFTELETAYAELENQRMDVFVAADAFEIDKKRIPKRCGFAYFVETADIETIDDSVCICKFQKADLIYKQILSIYSENAGNISGLKLDSDSCKILLFQPVSGGVGASTIAAACAVHLASKGKRTLYLNLEKFGSANAFFEASGPYSMSDIIFALKSKKANLSIKLESCVRQADNGVCFFEQSPLALDMMELTTDDILKLISELQLMGTYDYIVIDTDFSLAADDMKIYRKVHEIIWVGDGSELSNIKLFRSFSALNTLEQSADSPLTNRLSLLYNKFSNKSGKTLDELGIRNIGGAPRFEHASTAQLVQQISAMSMFDRIM